MSDLISRTEALEEMAQAECGLHYVDCETDNCSCAYITRILDLPSVSAEAVQGWIPCSERLPSDRGWYLITVQGINRFTDMDYYYGNSEWDEVSSKHKVIAWMPRPKPYRERSE